MTTLSRRNRYLLAILSGILLGLAFPPTGLAGSLLAFIALVPLLVALESADTLRKSFRTAFVTMFVLGLVANYWVGGWKSVGEADPFLMLGGVLLALVHPFFLVVPWLLYDITRRRFGRRPALYSLPVFTAGFEYAHSLGDLSYPWLNLYNTQSYNLSFIQFIEWTGPFALSMLIVLINVEIFQLLEGRANNVKHGAALLAMLVIPFLFGIYSMGQKEISGSSARVTILQPNIDPWAKWTTDGERMLDTNFNATRHALAAVHDSTDLVVWPETAITFFITRKDNSYALQELTHFVADMHHLLLTGFPDHEEYVSGRDSIPQDAHNSGAGGVYFRSWNAAMLLHAFWEIKNERCDTILQSKREVYHKQKLVPLGEHVPFVEVFPFLGRFFQWGVGLGSWNVGSGYEPLATEIWSGERDPVRSHYDSLRIYPAICYESVYPSFVRHFVDHGANLLAIITNDGWYGFSSGPYQHEQFATLRAIENRRYIVRSANTGISSVIDDRGRVLRALPLFVSGSITERVPLIERRTLYVRLGDFIAIPAMIATGIFAAYAIVTWFARRRKKLTTVELVAINSIPAHE